jgi:hypothetical protein
VFYSLLMLLFKDHSSIVLDSNLITTNLKT